MAAVMAGACGYLLKDSSIDQLIAGIRAAASGESLISPQIAAKVLQRLRSHSADTAAARAIRTELSDREVEVLRLIAIGKDNAEIARELYISQDRQESHLEHPHEAPDREPHPGGRVRRPKRNRLGDPREASQKATQLGQLFFDERQTRLQDRTSPTWASLPASSRIRSSVRSRSPSSARARA